MIRFCVNETNETQWTVAATGNIIARHRMKKEKQKRRLTEREVFIIVGCWKYDKW